MRLRQMEKVFAAFDFGKSIPDNTFAILAAEIDGDAMAASSPIVIALLPFYQSLSLL
jgi:hypothetical protein